MKLLLLARASEDIDGIGDYILVPLSHANVEVMGKRISLFRSSMGTDNDLKKMCFSDYSISLLTACGDLEEAIGKKKFAKLEDSGHIWLPDDFDEDEYCEKIEFSEMVMSCYFADEANIDIRWTCNLKNGSTTFMSDSILLEGIRKDLGVKHIDLLDLLDGIAEKMVEGT